MSKSNAATASRRTSRLTGGFERGLDTFIGVGLLILWPVAAVNGFVCGLMLGYEAVALLGWDWDADGVRACSRRHAARHETDVGRAGRGASRRLARPLRGSERVRPLGAVATLT
jgi:hypothetical protein